MNEFTVDVIMSKFLGNLESLSLIFCSFVFGLIFKTLTDWFDSKDGKVIIKKKS